MSYLIEMDCKLLKLLNCSHLKIIRGLAANSFLFEFVIMSVVMQVLFY